MNEKVIKDLDPKKSIPPNNIPVKILKFKTDFVFPFISKIFNESSKNAIFPDDLKLADITPVYKKNNSSNKVNYRHLTSIV